VFGKGPIQNFSDVFSLKTINKYAQNTVAIKKMLLMRFEVFMAVNI
jgi:hypothetical protein